MLAVFGSILFKLSIVLAGLWVLTWWAFDLAVPELFTFLGWQIVVALPAIAIVLFGLALKWVFS